MNTKYTLIFAAALALLGLPRTLAQYSLTTGLAGGTNNVAAASTNTSFAVILPAIRKPAVAIQPSFKLTGAGSSEVVFKFDYSADLANWTANAFTLTVTADGTNTVTGLTNLNVGAVGWVKLTTVENPNASAITNLTLKSAMKRPQ